KYAKSDGLSIAYQVIGHGSIDVVFVMGWVSHIELFWSEPHFADFLSGIASFSRLIVFDKRGTGLSDRPVSLPTMEERMDDVRAVMDAVNSERAALIGVSEGGAMCLLFAATYPKRVSALIIDGGYARSMWAPDYEWGRTIEQRERYFAYLEENWGSDVMIDARAPSLAHDEQFREWWSTYLRMSASPGAALNFSRMNWQIDIRHVLPSISVPTLVMHRTGDRAMDVRHGRYLAERIPGARYVEFPGNDHLAFTGPDRDAILGEIRQFLTGSPPAATTQRTLATLLFTEIAGAMAIAARIGDDKWRNLMEAHDRAMRDLLRRFRGREARKFAAGFLATFDGPARAIECALAFIEQMRALGIEVRAGLHTGEVDVSVDELDGVAVQIAARVMSRAEPGTIAVSSTVCDLVAGSGIEFERFDRPLPTGNNRSLDLYRVADRTPRLLAVPVPGSSMSRPDDDRPNLSPRETQVAELIGRGLSNRMIAEELYISVGTAERHVANIFTKLGFNARSQVAVWAFEHGLLPVRIEH
ncbi:MAG: alpha/beta fold hydrolase, partial [Thermomicrobiales bacterium]|nr:alpha/beta fold hydrolase [Thermomicrobiales bacterium]